MNSRSKPYTRIEDKENYRKFGVTSHYIIMTYTNRP